MQPPPTEALLPGLRPCPEAAADAGCRLVARAAAWVAPPTTERVPWRATSWPTPRRAHPLRARPPACAHSLRRTGAPGADAGGGRASAPA
eukprot:11197987-Alexandrium_andersonii.AAC.1